MGAHVEVDYESLMAAAERAFAREQAEHFALAKEKGEVPPGAWMLFFLCSGATDVFGVRLVRLVVESCLGCFEDF